MNSVNTLPETNAAPAAIKQQAQQTVYSILFTIAIAHFINDMCQSVLPSVYPMMKEKFSLSFGQIGMITFTFQLTASLLQPFVGIYTDKHPKPYSLVVGMLFTLSGLFLLSQAGSFYAILCAAGCIGIGSSIFHPEASRVAYLGSGARRGLAQSIFQVGGNSGSAFGPLLVALIVVRYGQGNILWFCLGALAGIGVLFRIAAWYKAHLVYRAANKAKLNAEVQTLPRKKVISSLVILLGLIFSKYFYLTSMTSYFTFYLIKKFNLPVQTSQLYLFAFLAAVAVGTVAGGPLGDKFGRKYVIWFSILGAAPFTILLPFANLFWTGVMAVCIGMILASAFSAILVYAQELIPGKVGMISGLFFGFAFGIAGIGSALLGRLADHTGILFVFHVCSFLPLLGIITGFLPRLEKKRV
jgi:FSR family fosmidomycin resistance protein-like MFS transporter